MPIDAINMKPMLATGNMDDTLAFYCGTLGFELGDKFESSGVISWCELTLGSVALMFTQHETHTDTPGAREIFSQTSIALYVRDVEALYEELASQGLEVSPIRVTFYGMKEFDVQDPTGYTLLIGEPSSEPPTIEGENDAPF